MSTGQRSGFVATVLAVLWSFAGIRRKRDYQLDAQRLKPIHVIVAGFMGGLLFVLTLVLVVRWVVTSG